MTMTNSVVLGLQVALEQAHPSIYPLALPEAVAEPYGQADGSDARSLN